VPVLLLIQEGQFAEDLAIGKLTHPVTIHRHLNPALDDDPEALVGSPSRISRVFASTFRHRRSARFPDLHIFKLGEEGILRRIE
jgi:hypothetical protein